MKDIDLNSFILQTIEKEVACSEVINYYRQPLVAFAAADNPLFEQLKVLAEPSHMVPGDLLPGARSVVSFFLPFNKIIVEANGNEKTKTAEVWCKAYIETNRLIGQITEKLISVLGEKGIRAAAEPATHNFNPVTLVSRWSHKSVAVVAGLGSFGLHQMVITEAGCAGRFGSLVMDTELAVSSVTAKERCLYYYDKSCEECVRRCPVMALSSDKALDKQRCWKRCLANARAYEKLCGDWADVCGKCATGPCSLKSAV
jgi:epoxyqueuosine reductase